jgi:CPA1 family monovalent cation:H+ antiporter
LFIAAGKLGWGHLETQAHLLLDSIDFNETLMQGMLSFLLFAGALHINLGDLAKQKWVISSLATAGILTSTFLVGGASYYLLDIFGIHLDFIYCLLFGSLISPTDPIAVLGILKSANAPKTLETKIAGESLFNDGMAVVVFIVLLGIATGGHDVTAGHIALLFLEEAVGGVVFGFVIGWLTYQLLRQVDNYQVEILLTLALVMGGYALASAIHTSGPIAVVVAGLLIGNQGRMLAMSEHTREHLDTFWELIDEILNAVLFVLIGLEVLVLPFTRDVLLASLAMIPLVLLARLISVALPISLLRMRREFSPGVITVLTWGGLRGGVSVALALSLPAGEPREIILAITYAIVVFSIVVQGLTIGRLVKSVV